MCCPPQALVPADELVYPVFFGLCEGDGTVERQERTALVRFGDAERPAAREDMWPLITTIAGSTNSPRAAGILYELWHCEAATAMAQVKARGGRVMGEAYLEHNDRRSDASIRNAPGTRGNPGSCGNPGD